MRPYGRRSSGHAKKLFSEFDRIRRFSFVDHNKKGSVSDSERTVQTFVFQKLFWDHVCNYYAVDHMFLSDATMLNKMSPFFSALFAVWLLKETITWVHVSFLSVAFVGCAFILKPGVEGLLSPEAGVALLGGLCAGIAYTEVRKLGTGGVDKNWIILFFSAFSCICALPFLVFDYAPMTASQLLFLILAGLTATGGQFGVTAAYCYVAAAEISIYDYSQIIFAALFGYLFFAQIPDLYSVVGYIIVCAAAIGMAMYSEKRNQKIEQDGREIR